LLKEHAWNPKFLNESILPDWWDDSMALEPAGLQLVQAMISNRLGLSFKDLVAGKVSVSDVQKIRYKKAKNKSSTDIEAVTNYALSIAKAVARGYKGGGAEVQEIQRPEDLRKKLLQESDMPWVSLRHILRLSWSLGIPVLNVKAFPTKGKKPDAFATNIDGYPVIVVLSKRSSPSWIAFLVAHELGHIFHGHLKKGESIVDLKMDRSAEGKEEQEANQFAVELLTGQSDLGLHSSIVLTQKKLAEAAKIFGTKYGISPGVVALNYGFTTGAWATANGAVSILEKNDRASSYFAKDTCKHLIEADFSEDVFDWLGSVLHFNPDDELSV